MVEEALALLARATPGLIAFVLAVAPAGAQPAAPRPTATPTPTRAPAPAPTPRPPAKPALPALSVIGFSIAEGDSGPSTGTFTISLSAPAPKAVTAHYATRNGTAIAGAGTTPGDYTPVSGTLTIPARGTSATIDVAVRGDRVEEPDEVFYLVLSKPNGATLAAAQGTGEILDDDGAAGPGAGPSLSIEDEQVGEGDSGRTPMTFTVRLSSSSTKPVTVDYATGDGSATEGEDYVPVSGQLRFPPGTTGRTITVPIKGDTVREGDEDFVVQLSNPVGAGFTEDTARGDILDDDGRDNQVMEPVGSPERRALAGQVVTLQVRVHGTGGSAVSGAEIQWNVDGAADLLDGGITHTDRAGTASQRVRLTQSPGRVAIRATGPDTVQTVVFQIAVATYPP